MAIKPLSADMNNVQKLAIPGLDTDMDVIQKLDDEPNDVGGLSPAELKAEFDKAGNIVKEYINGELLPAISDTVVEAEVRAEAEAGRVQAETEREEAEAGRADAEAARADAETLRAEAEGQRETAESGRATAEAARATAETERETAEAARVEAEQGRVTAEAGRAAAEFDRADAEAARAAAEAARDAAEDVRDAAIAKVEAAVDEAVTELRDGKYDLAGTAKNLVGKHNEEAVAHPDLRLEVQGVRSTAQAAERVAQQTAQAAAAAQAAADAALHALIDMEGRIDVVPYQFGGLTYTGEEQSPAWGGYDPEFMDLSGDTSGVDAGDYTVTFTPKEGFHWADGSTEGKEVTWSIGRAAIDTVPIQSGALTYTGETQSPEWVGYDSGKMTLGGVTEGTDAGNYAATFTPGDNYCWADGSTDAREVSWAIGRAAIPHVPYQSGSLDYTGETLSPEWVGYDSGKMTLGGVTEGTDAGSYTATFTPGDNYEWPDGTTEAKSANWAIDRAALTAVPTQSGALTYTGAVLSPSWSGYDSDKMTLGGVVSGVNVGTYAATFTPAANYKWSDGSTIAKTVNWSIGKAAILLVPSQSESLTYTGAAQSPTWSNYDAAKMTIGGATSGTAAGTYTATFTPTGNYQWSDGSVGAKSVNWSIGRAAISTVPSQSGSLTYTGAALTPAWSNYDAAKLTIGGTTSGTNAGSYTATFTPNGNCQWSDGTTGAKSVSWSIGKAAGSLSLDKISMTLNNAAKTGTITVTRAGDGAITATSSNTGVATVSVSGNVVTVTAKASGSVTITVDVAAGTNHTAPANQTCSVLVSLFSTTLESNTWAQIRTASDAGEAKNLWAVGDTKDVVVNGTVQGFSINKTVKAVIIGFNHNSGKEGDKRIHFMLGKDSANRMIAFCDSWYGNSHSGKFNTDCNWVDGDLRNAVMGNSGTPTNPPSGSFLSALPSELRSNMKSVTKYTDSGCANWDITDTTDYLFLLSEFEVFGKIEYACYREKDDQAQYDYFKAGNSKIAYRHDGNYAVSYLLRSPADDEDQAMQCIVESTGKCYRTIYDMSLGIVPCFVI